MLCRFSLPGISFSYEQKPGYPPEARLIATYAKSFSGKYVCLAGTNSVFIVGDLYYDDS
jgi:hypothetical protein